MAEDNSDQNIAQPQDGTQQTAPQTPSENVADEAQTSVTEPIAVPNAGEQPTTALPTVDAADGTAGNTADDTPDYASAAGERTVINNATQDAPTEQYRPAPEYGAYGPVPMPAARPPSNRSTARSSRASRRTTVRRSSALSATRIRPAISGTMAIRSAIRLAARPRRTARSRTISSSRSTARTCPLRDRATAIRSALRGRASRTRRTRRRSSPSRSPA